MRSWHWIWAVIPCMSVVGCAGSFSRAAGSALGSEGMVAVAPPSSAPSQKAQANAPVKLPTQAESLVPPSSPIKGEASVAQARDSFEPPALGAVKGSGSTAPTLPIAEYVLPKKLTKSAVKAGPLVAADSPLPVAPSPVVAPVKEKSSLPPDLASLLSESTIERSAAMATPEEPKPPSSLASAVAAPSALSQAIPRAIPKASDAPPLDRSTKGVALSGPSEVDSQELIEALAAARKENSEIQPVAHAVPEQKETALDPVAPAQASSAPSAPASEAKVETPAAATGRLEPAGPAELKPIPVLAGAGKVDSAVVRADGDESVLKKLPVVRVSGEKGAAQSAGPVEPAVIQTLKPVSPLPSAPVGSSLPEATSVASTKQASLPGSPPRFTIGRLHFCSEIIGFGNTVPRAAGPMLPGERLLAYVEMDHFTSNERDGMFETCVSCQIKLEDASGQIVFSQDFGDIVDRCPNRRKDFFCHFLLTVPDTLTPGKYRWRLMMTDKATKATSEQTLDAEIGSGERTERNDRT